MDLDVPPSESFQISIIYKHNAHNVLNVTFLSRSIIQKPSIRQGPRHDITYFQVVTLSLIRKMACTRKSSFGVPQDIQWHPVLSESFIFLFF